MKKVYLHNMEMIVTNKCNLDCAVCMCGVKNNTCMSDEVIEAALESVGVIGILNIGGGEPTLALEQIDKIISYIIKQNIKVDKFAVTINGTIYSKEFLKLLDKINTYIGKRWKRHILFTISYDKYHVEEVKKLGMQEEYLDNLKRYTESPHFEYFRDIDQKPFREGNAEKLDPHITVPLQKLPILLTYVKRGKLNIEEGFCNIGPIVTVNPNGIVTEPNASIEHQETIYNYGNVLTNSIEEICLASGGQILPPKEFRKEFTKALNNYCTYDE